MLRKTLSAMLVAIAFLFLCTTSAGAEEAHILSVYCAVKGDASDTFGGIPVPEDAEFISTDKQIPAPIIGSDSSFVDVGGDKYASVSFDAQRSTASLMFDVMSYEDAETESDLDELSEEETEEYSEAIAVMQKSGIGFGLFVPCGAEEPAEITVSVRLKCEKGMLTYRISAVAGVPMNVLCDLSAAKNFGKLEKITMSANCPGDSFAAERLYVTFPFVTDDWDFRFQSENGISGITVLSGRVSSADGTLSIEQEGDSNCVLAVTAPGDSKTLSEGSGGRILYLLANAENGSGSIAVLDEAKKSYTGSPMFLSGEGGEILARITEKDPDFSTVLSVHTDGEAPLKLKELRFVPTSEEDLPSKQVITSMQFEDGRLMVEGRLGEDTVREHMGKKLGLYMYPAVGKGETVHLGNVSVSSRFSFKVSMEKYPGAVYHNLFFVGIESESDKIVPLSEAEFATFKNTVASSGTPFGIYGADPISVYESGAPRVMVDVDLSRLITAGSASGSSVSRGGYMFGMNSEYVRELDRDIGFYTSSGASVYLKFICSGHIRSSTGEWLTNINSASDEYVILTSSDEARSLFVAGVSYICGRYSGIRSVVISSGINASDLTGVEPDDLYTYASEIAMLAHLAYSAAAEHGEGVFITLPFANEDVFASPVLMGCLVAERMSVLGQMTWAPMYTVTDTEPDRKLDTVTSATRANGTSAPSFSIMCWAPNGDSSSVVDQYTELCENSGTIAVQAIFLSLKELSEDPAREELQKMKLAMRGEGALLYESTMTIEEAGKLTPSGRYEKWSFADIYSADGWIPGYGISSLRTISEHERGRRVLRCVTSAEGGESSAIMLCTLDSPMSLSAAPYAEFVYELSKSDLAHITFLFGYGENRIEFSCSEPEVLPDGRLRSVCNIKDFVSAGKVDYVGIVIRGEGQLTFDLSSVTFISEERTDAELEELFREIPEDDNDVRRISPKVLMAGCLAALVSLTVSIRVVVYLSKRDKQNMLIRRK